MADKITPIAPDNVDKFSDLFHREWYLDHKVVSYKIMGRPYEILELWEEIALQTILKWDRAQPYLAIHDYSHRGIILMYTGLGKTILNMGVTAKGLEQAKGYLNEHPNFVAKIAVLANSTHSGFLASIFAELEALRRGANQISYRIFMNQTDALDWLAGIAD